MGTIPYPVGSNNITASLALGNSSLCLGLSDLAVHLVIPSSSFFGLKRILEGARIF